MKNNLNKVSCSWFTYKIIYLHKSRRWGYRVALILVILLLLQQQQKKRWRLGLIEVNFWLGFNCGNYLPVCVFVFSTGKLLKKWGLSIVASLLATLTFARGDKEHEHRKGNHSLFFHNAWGWDIRDVMSLMAMFTFAEWPRKRLHSFSCRKIVDGTLIKKKQIRRSSRLVWLCC